MTEIISVRFKSGGKQYYFDPCGKKVFPGQGVIVETSRGLEYGECTKGNQSVEDDVVVAPLRPLVRIATAADQEIIKRSEARKREAFDLCVKKIQEHKLDMKLIDVEFSFEGNKVLFYFTSDGRVDFRGLVRDLASIFRMRIELRQIGVRDEAKMLGGLGICGKPFCCSTFLGEFQPVSIRMAKTQGLSLNPVKISGTCGRLMCCLNYEQDAYEDAAARMPSQESFVETPDGIGTVCGVNLLREEVKVKLEDTPEMPRCYQNSEVVVVRHGRGKRPANYVPPRREELEKLRKTTGRSTQDKSVRQTLEETLQKIGVSERKGERSPDAAGCRKAGPSRAARAGGSLPPRQKSGQKPAAHHLRANPKKKRRQKDSLN